MAFNFNANQFDGTFSAHHLGNWEIPKIKSGHPRTRTAHTKVISDDRGHLLPDIPRPDTNPWGYYKNTWQLPHKITRQAIEQINAPLIGKNRWTTPNPPTTILTRKHNKCVNPDTKKKLPLNNIEYNNYLGDQDIHDPTSDTQQNITKTQQKVPPESAYLRKKKDCKEKLDFEYVPGDFTKPLDQHSSRGILLQQKYDRDQGKSPIRIHEHLPKHLYLEPHECTDPLILLQDEERKKRNISPHVLGDNVEDNFEKMRLAAKQIPQKPNERSPSPILPAYCNFQMARKMHKDNLDHQPLPDSVIDKAFRRLQAEGDAYPGLGLDIMPSASGVGVRTHNAGPTHCTKMKIFRPKTCGVVPKPLPPENLVNSASNIFRPQSVIDKKMGAMDLAICWDFRPANPLDEPKRSRHIDGTNESSGPAVFTVVRTPRTPDNNQETGRSGGVFTNTFGELNFFDKDIMRKKAGFAEQLNGSPIRRQQQQSRNNKMAGDLKCTCGTSPINFGSAPGSGRSRSKSTSRDGSAMSENRKRYKSSPNLSRMAISEEQFKENTINYNNYQVAAPVNNQQQSSQQPVFLIEKRNHRRHDKPHTCSKYAPKNHETNESNNNNRQPKGFFKRTTRLCHKVAPQPYPEEREKQFYKAAFRAGVPKSNAAGTLISSDSGCSTMSNSSTTCSSQQPQKVLVVPRPRNPYTKRNYNIDTLVPPFTCFKGGAGQGGYPEHWRLASVYQHAYKPIDQRRRPLLQTVYK